MNIYLAILLLVVGSWLLLFLVIGWADRSSRTRMRASLEVRAWEEKVAAMRRMAEQDAE